MTVALRSTSSVMLTTGTGNTYAGSTSGALSATMPSGTVDNDVMLAVVSVTNNTSMTCTPPAGWTLLGSANRNPTSIAGKLFVYVKVASGETGPYAFTLSGFSATTVRFHVGQILTFSGADTTTPVDVSLVASKSSTPPLQSQAVTTTKDDALLVHVVNANASPTTEVWTGATKATDSGGSNNGLSSATEAAPTAGAQVARTVVFPNANVSSTTYDYASATIAIEAPTVAPANTVAPAASGTASVGSVLSTTNGTWSGSPTSYAYQWKRDGSNISGATASTYTAVSADAGHTLTCAVTATNTAGSASATSNGVAIPAAPVNTVAPAITPSTGPYNTGDTIGVGNGTWTGTGIAYTYQWFRTTGSGTTLLTGYTASSYTLQVTDEGANVYCQVTATNGGGAVSAASNTITPAVSSPISDASFSTTLSGGSGNTDPALSIGGARGGTYTGGVNALLGPILGSVAQAGGTFYRVVYVRNTHASATAAAMKLWVTQQFVSGSGLALAVAVPTQGVNTTVPALASGTTAPSGVTWTTATDSASGADFGDLGPGAYRGIYIRLTVSPGATPSTEVDATFRVEGSAA